jgi:hypothetical protein
VLLRRQADLLAAGAQRVQHILDDYDTRLRTLKPAASVALHELFGTTEPWNVETVEIARQLVDARVRPGLIGDRDGDDVLPSAMSARSREAFVKTWNASLGQRRRTWRNRMGIPVEGPEQRRVRARNTR